MSEDFYWNRTKMNIPLSYIQDLFHFDINILKLKCVKTPCIVHCIKRKIWFLN